MGNKSPYEKLTDIQKAFYDGYDAGYLAASQKWTQASELPAITITIEDDFSDDFLVYLPEDKVKIIANYNHTAGKWLEHTGHLDDDEVFPSHYQPLPDDPKDR